MVVRGLERTALCAKILENGSTVEKYATLIPAEAVADAIACISEDRKLDGFFDTLSVADNIGLGWLAKIIVRSARIGTKFGIRLDFHKRSKGIAVARGRPPSQASCSGSKSRRLKVY